jgi:hypothetical protein
MPAALHGGLADSVLSYIFWIPHLDFKGDRHSSSNTGMRAFVHIN